jgi:hypothetical protein
MVYSPRPLKSCKAFLNLMVSFKPGSWQCEWGSRPLNLWAYFRAFRLAYLICSQERGVAQTPLGPALARF